LSSARTRAYRVGLQVGDECAQHRAMLETSYPVENGIVKDWAGMQNIWDYTFFGHSRGERERLPTQA
jgi:actin-related protein 2